MTEPTDHRAEHWISLARSNWTDGTFAADPRPGDIAALAAAIIAIAHDLHRIADALEPKPSTFTIRPGLTTAVTGSNPTAPSESQRCDARHLELRCVFWAGHKDPHRGTWTSD